ncbi:MAG: oligosaccharide flippase family protein [Patescibacteria group bacterium]|nr:oligosaccharide flippase family protein [Patescibacteria group bacterium]
MKFRITYIARHPLALSGFLVLGSNLFGNIFAYLFNLFSAKMLGPSEYGAFASVMAVIGITGVFSQSVQTTVTKFVSGYRGIGKEKEIKDLISGLTRAFIFLGFSVFLGFFVFRNQLSDFLNIPYPVAFILVGLMIWFSFLQTINLGSIAGLQKFQLLAGFGFLSSFLKFAFGLSLIYLGFRVNGAVLGVVLSVLFVYVLSYLPLRSYLSFIKEINLPWKNLFKYSLPAAFSLWGIASLAGTDVVLVKKFFNPSEAGVYSFVALIGRVVFFASSSIGTIMFPLVSERASGGRKHSHLLYYVLFITLIISSAITTFYFVFPSLTIYFFSGFSRSAYLEGSSIVGYLGFYYLLYSLANVLILYYLSLHRTLISAILPFISALMQLWLISRFHASFTQVIFSSIFSVLFLLVSLLLYFLFNERRN